MATRRRSSPARSGRRVRHHAVVGAALALAIASTVLAGTTVLSPEQDDAGPAPRGGPAANIWIDATAEDNECLRSATRAGYSSTRACSTLVSACARARPGDLVNFADGSYAGETIVRSQCDPRGRVTFAVPDGGNVVFHGHWRFGDHSSGRPGPRKITIHNWRFRRNVSGSDRVDWYEVRDFTAAGLVVQAWDITAAPASRSRWNMVIENGDFGDCDGDGAKGLFADRCITRIIGGAGIVLRNNRWWGYPAPGSNCTVNVDCPRGVALGLIFSEGEVTDVLIEGNRFSNNAVTNIRIQPRDRGVARRVTIRHNEFAPAPNGAIAVDNTSGNVRQLRVVRNSLLGGISGLGVLEFGQRETWGPGSELAGNILTRGGPGAATCDTSGNVRYRANLVVPFSPHAGNYVCHGSERLQRWSAGSVRSSLFGYALAAGKLRPDPKEAAVVRRIFDEAARGRTAAHIAAALRRTRAAGPAGRRWTADTVRQVLRDRAYLGGMYGTPASHPRLVPARVWRRAQQ